MTTTSFESDSSQAAYLAAAMGRRLRMYRPGNFGPNAALRGSLETVRARARAAARNDSWAGTAADKLVYNMIGTGIQARSMFGSKAQRDAITEVWDSWCAVCDADSVLDFYGLQALVVREWDEVGECFARIRPRRLTDGLPVPMQIQLIESEQCPANYYSTAPNGNQIRAGIEFSAIGARVAYWFYPVHPYEQDSRQSLILARVPAEEVLHIYEPLRIGQLRGIPRTTSILLKLWNLDNAADAAVERFKLMNLFAAFFTKNTNAPGGGAMVPGATLPGGAKQSDGTELPNLEVEPGSGYQLPEGWDVKFSTPPAVGSDLMELSKLQLLAIAARHGVPYEVLTGDLGAVSDRALRLILNEFRRFLEQRQWLYLIPMFCQPVRAAFFDAGILGGAFDIVGYAKDRAKIIKTKWLPQGWPYSHPVQDVAADTKAVRSGFKSRQSVIYGNGDDPEQVRAERQLDNQQADADQEKLDSDPRYTSDVGKTQATPAGSGFPEDDTAPAGDPGGAPAPGQTPPSSSKKKPPAPPEPQPAEGQ